MSGRVNVIYLVRNRKLMTDRAVLFHSCSWKRFA